MSYDKQLETEQQTAKNLDPDEVMQKASEYAERFTNDQDRQRFLAGVSAKLPSEERTREQDKEPEL